MASSVEGTFVVPPSLVSSLKEALKGRLETEEKKSELESSSAADQVEDCLHSSDESNDRPFVLVTNENGIHSAGLKALVQVLRGADFCNVYVCAPQFEQGEVGHSISTQKTLEVCDVGIEGVTAYEVSGTPADCVSLGLSGALFSKKPSLVVCGMNKGSNCGFHIFSSGTVAGAREAFICGVPSLALSLDWKNEASHEDDLSAAAKFCLPLIRAAICDSENGSFFKGFFLNINLPTPFSQHKGFRITRQGTSRLAINWRVVPSQKGVYGMGLCKQNAIGVRVAQLGLAASAVGAARRANSSIKNIEVESIAGPANGSHVSMIKKKHHYQMEIAEAVGDTDNTSDFGALQDGFVSVTPLGSINDSDTELLRKVADWMGSFLKLDSPLVL